MKPDFAELVTRHRNEGPIEQPTSTPMAWVRVTNHDGRVQRHGPYERWIAELVITSIGFDSGEARTAILEPEPEWVSRLVSDRIDVPGDAEQ